MDCWHFTALPFLPGNPWQWVCLWCRWGRGCIHRPCIGVSFWTPRFGLRCSCWGGWRGGCKLQGERPCSLERHQKLRPGAPGEMTAAAGELGDGELQGEGMVTNAILWFLLQRGRGDVPPWKLWQNTKITRPRFVSVALYSVLGPQCQDWY